MSFGNATNTTFLGLATTTAIFAGIGGTCLIGFEVMRQLKRLPNVHFRSMRRGRNDSDRSRATSSGKGATDGGGGKGDEVTTCEDWEMGHLYHARTFHATTPSPPLAKWPLQWAWQAVRFDDWFYATHTGMDTVIYVRFLKACISWTLLHTLTTAPTLLAIHFHYSEQFVKSHAIDESNMARASLSYVAASPSIECASTDKEVKKQCIFSPNPQGQKILWVHLLLLYYMTFTWWYFLWRLAHGGLKIRWRLIQRIRETEAQKADQSQRAPLTQENLDSRGWRQRTLMIANLPATMRDEAGIRRYFEEYLRPDDASTVADERDSMIQTGVGSSDHHDGDSQYQKGEESGELHRSGTHQTLDQLASPVKTMVNEDGVPPESSSKRKVPEPKGPEPDMQPDRHLKSPVQAVVLVRKMNELSSLLARRQAVLGQLEAAHVKLASAVLADVRARLNRQERGVASDAKVEPKSLRGRLDSIKKRTRRHIRAQNSSDVEARDGVPLSERNLRTEELIKHLGPFVRSHDHQRAQAGNPATDDDDIKVDETIWEALAEIPRELLDPYQPVTRLSALFRGQTVPTIDYLLTKLNLLTALVTEMRARPPSSYAPASIAFVTFRDPRQARMVWRELKDQIVVKVRLAPEVKDLDWERLMSTTFSGEVVRGAGVSVFVWGMTLFWTILIGLLTSALANFTNIGALKQFFIDNPKLAGFVNTTLPSLAVALITMSVPELVFQISKRAQGFVAFSQLYDMCLTRYWKFVILNVVVFFAVGSAALQTIIATFTGSDTARSSSNILSTIGYSFPTSAPYFVSYLILGMGLHSGFELLGFMVPLIQHWGARTAKTPRARAIKTLPRNFNRYYWLPFHVLIVTILFIFSLLNPLVLPFGLVYLLFAFVVFKKNLAFIYYRRFNEMEGVVYFVRILRFSLDGLVVGQAVLLILFAVLKLRAVYIGFCALTIPLTVIFKLLATRWWRSQCRALDEEEACALCGVETLRSSAEAGHSVDRSYGVDSSFRGSLDAHAPLDARATGRYPPIILPLETNSLLYNTWQKIHDSFHANGYDRPSYMSHQGAKGERVDNIAVAGAKALAHVPAAAARGTAHAAKHRASIAKATLGLGRGHEVKAMEAELDAAAHRAMSVSAGPPEIQVTEEISDEDRVHLSRSKTARSRGASFRSEEAPFLSSFDVLSSHAPVPTHDDDDADGNDHLRVHSTPKRNRGHRGTVKKSTHQDLPALDTSLGTNYSGQASDAQRDPDVSEFGAMLGAASGPDLSGEVDPLNRTQTDGAEADGEEGDDSEWDDDVDDDDVPLVRRHAPVTWDDTPNNAAKYNNPFYNHHLDPFLWLPRDPTQALNLFDTLEWYGPALVSSQGGAGHVGEWDEEEDEVEEKGSLSDIVGGDNVISGREEIVLNDTLARHLEEAEEVEETQDIAASVPKAILNDYRNMIRHNSRSETGDSVAEEAAGDLRLERQGSFASVMSSIRSPTRTIRQRAEHSPSAVPRGQSRTFSATTSDMPSTSLDRSELGQTAIGAGGTPALQITDATITNEPDETIQTTLSPTSQHADMTGSSSGQRTDSGGRTVPQSAAMVPGQTSHSIAFAGSTKPQDHERHTRMGTHPRRATGASTASHAPSAISSGGGGQRPVTLQQALRAEILEEEYRTTVKERLITLKRSKMVSKLGGSALGRGRRRSSKAAAAEEVERAVASSTSARDVAPRTEAAQAQEGLDTSQPRLDARTHGIMARHALRRQLARSEGGEQTMEELLQAARNQGIERFNGAATQGGHRRGLSLGQGRSRGARREASTSAAVVAGLASATAMPTSATWNPGGRSTSAARLGGDAEAVPMREFGVVRDPDLTTSSANGQQSEDA